MSLDTAYDLAGLGSDLYLGAEKLFGLRYCFALNDLTDLELQFCKIIVGDLPSLGFSTLFFES